VHLYFDKDQGSWVRLPLAWELYSEFVKEMMSTIRVMQLFYFTLYISSTLMNTLLKPFPRLCCNDLALDLGIETQSQGFDSRSSTFK